MNFLTRINYMKYAKGWIVMSIILTVLGLGVFLTRGLNQGIDFTGGMLYDIRFEESVSSAQVEELVRNSLDTKNVGIQKAQVKGEENAAAVEYLLRTPELSQEQNAKLKQDLEQLGTFSVISEEQVSASVSNELRNQAILAVAIAAVLQIIYLWIRFQFKFGITAVLALLHDVVITIGLLSVFRIQINAAFVAAMLTILGYSINDTVVVFDRIRENLARRKKGEDLEALATRSIQEVITRSVLTGVAVQFTLVCLLIWGGDSTWDFAMTLFIGLVSGTYSSIFIAAALWLFWQKWEDKRHKELASRRIKPVKA